MHSLCQVSCVDSYHSSGKPLRNQRRIKHHLQFGHFGTGGVTLGGPDMDEVGWNIVLVVSWLDSFKIKHQTSNIKLQTPNSPHTKYTTHHTPHTTPHIKQTMFLAFKRGSNMTPVFGQLGQTVTATTNSSIRTTYHLPPAYPPTPVCLR